MACIRGRNGKNVVVVNGDIIFAWNPELLTKLTEAEVAERLTLYSGKRSFQCGDFVREADDVHELQRLQDDHVGLATMAGDDTNSRRESSTV